MNKQADHQFGIRRRSPAAGDGVDGDSGPQRRGSGGRRLSSAASCRPQESTASELRDDGANRRTPLGGQVGNLVLKLPGTIRGPRRMLSAHIDTVPVCLGSRPVRKGGRVVSADKSTGLGADDRSGTAVLLSTVLAIVRGKLPHPPLTILWTVQEEVGLFGARHVKKSLLGESEAGVQLRRRLAGEAHARCDRRLPNDDRRRAAWRATPAARRPRE